MNLIFSGSMDILSSTDLSYLGGIVGCAVGTTSIIHCVNTADLNTLKGQIGGITGGGDSGAIIACRNIGNISNSGNTGLDIVAGVMPGGGSTIIGCVNSGDISNTNTYAGGIGAYDVVCIACWSNASTITAQYPGAIVGYANADSNNCYWKRINGVEGTYVDTITNSGSFTGNTPTADQIVAMNAAWAAAQPTGREYQFDANGNIVKIP